MSVTVTTTEEAEHPGVEAEAGASTIEIVTRDETLGGAAVSVSLAADDDPIDVVLTTELRTAIVAVSESGAPGPPGPPGGSAAVEFVQDVPALVWTIPHALTYFPVVSVYDTAGNRVDVEVHQAVGVVTVQLEYPLAGKAFLI